MATEYTDTKHLNIRVTGLVQGVFYRATANLKATQLGLNGFVRNERDGSVYIEVEGPADKLAIFTMWCQQGSTGARVDKVETEEGVVKGFDRFETKR
ncbi:MAG TPA: acylphosphatase [Chitinophagales bacterium]|nr:acylphosphatase [Chitinophagales bacterium]